MHEDVLPVYARIRAAHVPEHHHSGDGYTEPREWWVSCSCGVTIYAGMQGLGSGIPGLDEHDSVEAGWAIHILSVFANPPADDEHLPLPAQVPSLRVPRYLVDVLANTSAGDAEQQAAIGDLIQYLPAPKPDDEEDNPIEQSLLGNDQEDQQ